MTMDAVAGRRLRVGVDATSWVSRRGFGRFIRNAVGRLVEVEAGTSFVFFIDETNAGSARLPGSVDVRQVAVARAPTQAAAAGSTRSVPDLLRLSRAVRRERLDAFLFPSLYTWFPVLGTPTIVGVHDTMIEELPELTVPSRRDRIAVTLKHRLGIGLAATLFTVSEYSRRSITARLGIRPDRLHLVPEAPDPVFAPREGAALTAGLASAGLRPEDHFFLFFGGISPHKNIEALLDAYAVLRRTRGSSAPLLVLVGELEGSAYLSAAGSVRDRIAAHDLGSSVRLPGYVSDDTLACLCSAADAVVLPSLAEGFGLPAVEAAACGAPLALSELDAHRETMGDAALYFAPRDVAALTVLLDRLAADEDLRRDLSGRARARFASHRHRDDPRQRLRGGAMGVLILMYHGVERRHGPLFVDPATFAAHADAIVESRAPVLTMSEIGDALRARRLPERGVALTFDDGFVSVVENAAPILVERGLRATVFCVAGRLGGTNQWPTGLAGAPDVKLADARAIASLAAAGFEIGAHGTEHEPFNTGDPAVIRAEIADARASLEERLGVRVRSVAYPYGALPSPAALAAVRETYTTAVTTRIGRVDADADRYGLPRVDAHYVRSPRIFRAVLDGRANAYLALRRTAALARRRIALDYAPRAREAARP